MPVWKQPYGRTRKDKTRLPLLLLLQRNVSEDDFAASCVRSKECKKVEYHGCSASFWFVGNALHHRVAHHQLILHVLLSNYRCFSLRRPSLMSGSWVGVRLFNENGTVIQKKTNLNKHNQLDTIARWLAWNYFSTDNQIIISSTRSVNITLLKWDNIHRFWKYLQLAQTKTVWEADVTSTLS